MYVNILQKYITILFVIIMHLFIDVVSSCYVFLF